MNIRSTNEAKEHTYTHKHVQRRAHFFAQKIDEKQTKLLRIR